MKEALLWWIGNGESAPIWGANWVPIPTTFCVQSPPRVVIDIAVVGTSLTKIHCGGISNYWKRILIGGGSGDKFYSH